MGKCTTCDAELKELFSSTYCPNTDREGKHTAELPKEFVVYGSKDAAIFYQSPAVVLYQDYTEALKATPIVIPGSVTGACWHKTQYREVRVSPTAVFCFDCGYQTAG